MVGKTAVALVRLRVVEMVDLMVDLWADGREPTWVGGTDLYLVVMMVA